MTFTIEGDPRGQGRPRFFRGHAYKDKKDREYEDWIRNSWTYANGYKQFTNETLKIEIKAYFSIPKSDSKAMRLGKQVGSIRPTKKPDIDNIAKSILDGLNGIAYDDDKQIVQLLVYKYYGVYPRVEVTIDEVKY